jgi:hypothetical protein
MKSMLLLILVLTFCLTRGLKKFSDKFKIKKNVKKYFLLIKAKEIDYEDEMQATDFDANNLYDVPAGDQSQYKYLRESNPEANQFETKMETKKTKAVKLQLRNNVRNLPICSANYPTIN